MLIHSQPTVNGMAGSNSAEELDGLQVWTAANVVTKQLRIADKG